MSATANSNAYEQVMADRLRRALISEGGNIQYVSPELQEFYKQSKQQFLGQATAPRPTNSPTVTRPADNSPIEPWAALSGDELTAKSIPPRNTVLSENGSTLFYESSVNQILAWRGVGKTLFGLGLADAIASGGKILDFQADRPRRVLYLDGELPLAQLQERVKDVVGEEYRHNVRLFNPEMMANPRGINLLDQRDFVALRRLIEASKTEVLIIDSQSTLMTGDSNKTEFQEGRLEVLRALRWMGLCVIETHHVGKAGLQRGLSRNDDILDVQMHLKGVAEWDPADGLLFEMTYDKVRHAARLESGYQVTRSDGQWIRQNSMDMIDASKLFQEGKSVREVAKKMEVSVGRAHKLKKLATKAGLIKPAIVVGQVAELK
jgi:hypothetical protein